MLALLSGPLLRFAETASDLARELNEPANVVGLEEPDGGVGDDAGETIRTDSCVECWDPSQFEMPVFEVLSGSAGFCCPVQLGEIERTQIVPPSPATAARVIMFQCPLC
jgi:hypothetical protein